MNLSRFSASSRPACLVTTLVAFTLTTLPGCGDSASTGNSAPGSQSEAATAATNAASTGTPAASTDEPALNSPSTGTSESATDATPTATDATIGIEAPLPATTTTAERPSTAPASSTSIAPGNSAADEAAAAEQLESDLAALKVPPDWLASVASQWDTNKPWKDARLEIRRLLGKGDDASRREGIKLMWDYKTKGDMGNGHEYGMYLFLGGEPLWAIRAFRERLAEPQHEHPPYFDAKGLASLYTNRGVFSQAEELLLEGLDWKPPKAEWTEMRQAEMHDSLGDLYAAWGRLDDARNHYQESVRIYPLGKPPYGRHLLPRRAKKVQAKLDLLSLQSLAGATLKDGTWQHTALGYSGDVKLSVSIAGGRIADIDIQHEEKIDQGATTVIPQRIIASQSLAVDGVSGATVTKDAIVTGTLEALRKAGLK